MAKPVVEEFEIEGMSVRLTKQAPEDHRERARFQVEIDNVVRGTMVLSTGVRKPWEAWSVIGRPKKFNDFCLTSWHGTGEQRRVQLARQMVEWMKAGKPLPSPEEHAAAVNERQVKADQEAQDYAVQRQKYVNETVEVIQGMKALRERLGTELSNREAMIFDEAMKLIYSGAPYEATQIEPRDKAAPKNEDEE